MRSVLDHEVDGEGQAVAFAGIRQRLSKRSCTPVMMPPTVPAASLKPPEFATSTPCKGAVHHDLETGFGSSAQPTVRVLGKVADAYTTRQGRSRICLERGGELVHQVGSGDGVDGVQAMACAVVAGG